MLGRGRDGSTSGRPGSEGSLGRTSQGQPAGGFRRRRALGSRSVWAAFLCTLGIATTIGLTTSSASLASNQGDVWVDNVGQPAGPGHEMDPHLACANINLWGAGMADSSGSFTIDGWPPSGSQELLYSDNWQYNQGQGGDQVMAVIDVGKLIKAAVANGDAPVNSQGFHFKLQYTQDPQKHKTFWVNCGTPTLATSAISGVVGGSIQDTATLAGGNSPTGTITWKLYGPSDPRCSTPLQTYTDNSINGDGTYYSPTYQANTIGTYQWVASYSGDGQDLGAAGSCNDPAEQSTVIKDSPGLTTKATSATVGGSIQDTAALSGGDRPTGTITWKLYGPSDPNCSLTPIQMYTDSNVNGDGNYDSPTYVATTVGTYRWVASYSGDGQNLSTAGSCNDPGEDSPVNPAVPSLTTDAVNGTAGGSIHDTATLTGGYSPTGTITWNLYDAAADPTCSTPLNTTTISVPVTGDGVYDSPDFSMANPGTYQWVASYSGDGNNASVAGACGDTAEQSTVSTNPAPKIALTKLEQVNSTSPGGYVRGPVYGNVGDTVDYQMTVTNTGNTPLVIAFTDPGCDLHTLSGTPTVLTGTYDPATQQLSSGGELRYTCSHVLTSNDQPPAGYTNTATVQGTPPTGPALTKQSSVQAFAMVPGIKVVKFERDASTGGAFVRSPSTITVSVGDKIDYEIQVTNTGNQPLALTAVDPHCDSGTLHGPTSVSGKLSGHTLSPGGVAQYTCSHVTVAADLPQYTNTVTVTGRPPSGPPVHGGSTVVANLTKAAIRVLKLERDASAGGPFTRGPITVTEHAGSYVVHTIQYEVLVTNTGNAPLTLRLDDPRCDAGTVAGPVQISGTLNGDVLSPGGEAQYTCSHDLVKSDPSPFTNTATVTGTPPVGPPVSGTSKVTVKKQTVAAKKICRTSSGRVIHYTGHRKPAACRFHPKKPKHPGGFTG